MTKTLQVRIEEKLHSGADDVLGAMGLDLPTAVRMFLTKVVQTRGIPFELQAGDTFEAVPVDQKSQAKMDAIGELWKARRKTRR